MLEDELSSSFTTISITAISYSNPCSCVERYCGRCYAGAITRLLLTCYPDIDTDDWDD